MNVITYEDFKKIELKVAKVLEAERMEGSEKLLKLKLDLGEAEPRQVIAGIGKNYDPEKLLGKEIIIVANLEPRQLMGLESNGMLLAADSANGPVILMPEKEVEPGILIK
ncbi:MAG: methionine--tRNA ligase subunit beta [Candidatus Yanofskybacteria bacterium RIFCSPHIGHO2_02_FULL_43_15c]|uniref:Methionine--tRNA ligase n=2 Tax=Candidatus Yanofskyibacteriota TaxID=1752733 RepID=A0A1F8H4Y5_9BACT|nr:MAG: methionine--tRNA ligase subunit beta [Candidatus Yanofskybacteria bacterium RIFCSPHIGHO2_02_FULL_43_15c]OGN32654.1 MAG: methionine--tRNA ligase subunit beta [Candidatus Yanofskybacteria bacterium RIFCSPLOWO2_02_FULL_43_10b]